MKRFTIIFLALLLLALTAQAQDLSHVNDLANVLSADEEAKLQQQAEELYRLTQFDVLIHTTRDSQGKGPRQYSFDYYENFRDSKQYKDGAMLALMFDNRDYYEAARGKGIQLLTYSGSHDLAQVVEGKLRDANYYGAFSDYIRYVQRKLIPPAASELAGERVMELAPYLLIGGLVVGLIYALVLRGKLKVAKTRYGAAQYVMPGSLNLTNSQDLYLYQTVVRHKIESNNNSSGRGSSGGGFSTGSSGGTSYGGRGGKF